MRKGGERGWGKREKEIDRIKELIIRDVTRLVSTQSRVQRVDSTRQVTASGPEKSVFLSLSRCSFSLLVSLALSLSLFLSCSHSGSCVQAEKERKGGFFSLQMRWEVVKIELRNFMDGKSLAR